MITPTGPTPLATQLLDQLYAGTKQAVQAAMNVGPEISDGQLVSMLADVWANEDPGRGASIAAVLVVEVARHPERLAAWRSAGKTAERDSKGLTDPGEGKD